MTRRLFEQELQALVEDVVVMAERAGEAIHRAVQAVRTGDPALAEAVIAEDDRIDATHLALEERCMRLLATQQPMATDLRTIASVFAITIDVERMADHAEGISKAAKRLARVRLPDTLAPIPQEEIPEMEGLVQEMLRDTLAAFRAHDPGRAERMAAKDDQVDDLRSRVFHDALGVMIDDPRTVEPALELIITTQHLERAADHITNIGERIIYMVTGQMRELNV